MNTTRGNSQVSVKVDGVNIKHQVIHAPAVHGELEIDEAVLNDEMKSFTFLYHIRLVSLLTIFSFVLQLYVKCFPRSVVQGQTDYL